MASLCRERIVADTTTALHKRCHTSRAAVVEPSPNPECNLKELCLPSDKLKIRRLRPSRSSVVAAVPAAIPEKGQALVKIESASLNEIAS